MVGIFVDPGIGIGVGVFKPVHQSIVYIAQRRPLGSDGLAFSQGCRNGRCPAIKGIAGAGWIGHRRHSSTITSLERLNEIASSCIVGNSIVNTVIIHFDHSAAVRSNGHQLTGSLSGKAGNFLCIDSNLRTGGGSQIFSQRNIYGVIIVIDVLKIMLHRVLSTGACLVGYSVAQLSSTILCYAGSTGDGQGGIDVWIDLVNIVTLNGRRRHFVIFAIHIGRHIR